MKKRYIVCVSNSEKIQDEEYINYLRKKGLAWWHWIDNVWLLCDNTGHSSVTEIRDSTKTIFKNGNNLILEISANGDTWSGFGPNTPDKNMFKWIQDNWSNF